MSIAIKKAFINRVRIILTRFTGCFYLTQQPHTVIGSCWPVSAFWLVHWPFHCRLLALLVQVAGQILLACDWLFINWVAGTSLQLCPEIMSSKIWLMPFEPVLTGGLDAVPLYWWQAKQLTAPPELSNAPWKLVSITVFASSKEPRWLLSEDESFVISDTQSAPVKR